MSLKAKIFVTAGN